MDGDLQNAPTASRRIWPSSPRATTSPPVAPQRQDAFVTRTLPSRLANGLISLATKVKLHDYGCTLKAFRREVVKSIRLYGEMHRFIPAIASFMGVRIAEVKVNHRPRRAGQSKYGLGRTTRVLLDLITVKFLLSYATRPLQVFGLWGLVSGGAGFLLGLYYTIAKLFFSVPLANKPGLILAVLLMLVGVQLIGLGLLGEIQVRTYYETQAKPTYAVRQVRTDRRTGPAARSPRMTASPLGGRGATWRASRGRAGGAGAFRPALPLCRPGLGPGRLRALASPPRWPAWPSSAGPGAQHPPGARRRPRPSPGAGAWGPCSGSSCPGPVVRADLPDLPLGRYPPEQTGVV